MAAPRKQDGMGAISCIIMIQEPSSLVILKEVVFPDMYWGIEGEGQA